MPEIRERRPDRQRRDRDPPGERIRARGEERLELIEDGRQQVLRMAADEGLVDGLAEDPSAG